MTSNLPPLTPAQVGVSIPPEERMDDEAKQFWLKFSDGWTENGLAKIEEAAKQLITVNGFFLAGYQVMLEGFLKKELVPETSVTPILAVLTIFFAVASIWCCMAGVIFTEEVIFYKEPYQIRQTFLAARKKKQDYLTWAMVFFSASAFCSVITIVIVSWPL